MARGWLIGVAALLGAVLVASIVVALLERELPLPEGTPEAAVQMFLSALEDDRHQVAYNLLSSDLKQACTAEEFATGSISAARRMKDDRVTLEGTTTVNDTVFVTIRVSRFRGGGPFVGSESAFEQRFALRKEEGKWRFSAQPWPYSYCPRAQPIPARPAPPVPRPTLESAVPTPTPSPEPTR